MIEYTTEETKLIPWKDRRRIEKKVLTEYYKGIRTHKKMFELRKDEDGIKPGDILVLREWDGEKYTGGMTRREVTAVLRDCPEYGLMEGYCILSLQTPGWDYFKPSATLDQVRKKAYKDGYDAGFGRKIDASYQEGLSDAWEAARRIGSDSRYGLEEMGFKFEPRSVGDDPGWYVVQRYSASECIEKIRQYEQEKEEQKQLQVGDEVKLKRCDIYAVYMGGVNGSNERNVYLCFNDGSCGVQSKSEIERKTGRHFPEIAEVLRKMREGQDG